MKLVPAAETLATGKAIDEAKILANTYSELLDMHISIRLCVDSKNLFLSLSTQRNSINRSTRADVACICYEYQVGTMDKITGLPGKFNLADGLTKKYSVVSDAQMHFDRHSIRGP